MTSAKKLISIITPCFNEGENVRACYEAVKRVFEAELPGYEREHIFCDNASGDDTVEILREIAANDHSMKVIVNSRNFGPFRSTFNGILQSAGDAVLAMLAADLQDPPELVPAFVRKWEEGYKVVYGIRKTREENRLVTTVRRLFYHAVNRFSEFHIPENVGEFQLIDRIVVEHLRHFDDYYPYIRGMIASCGFSSVGIEYTWQARRRGLSKNSLYNLVDQALNGVTSTSHVPLRICLLAGFVLSGLSVTYALLQLIINLVFFRQLVSPGIATLIVALFFFSGVQLFFTGLLGEYIGAIYSQVRKRPIVVERERINFE
jgi:glycosyltransferase involved in cell wall biosynthesis